MYTHLCSCMLVLHDGFSDWYCNIVVYCDTCIARTLWSTAVTTSLQSYLTPVSVHLIILDTDCVLFLKDLSVL